MSLSSSTSNNNTSNNSNNNIPPKRLRSDPLPTTPQVLNSLCNSIIQQSAATTTTNTAKIIFITGAGLSQASGIPPFRGTNDATWSKFITEWGTKKKFLQDPITWYREFWFSFPFVSNPTQYFPNAGHKAIASIVERFPNNVMVITQNIDCLHSHPDAFIPKQNLIQCHGSFIEFKCTWDDCPYSFEKTFQPPIEIPIITMETIPKCPDCQRIMLPNALLFDEDYEDHESYQFDLATEWIENATSIIFVGTSFSVQITDLALKRSPPPDEMYNFNLYGINSIPKSKTSGDWMMKLYHVQGKAEETLPMLWELIHNKLLLLLERGSNNNNNNSSSIANGNVNTSENVLVPPILISAMSSSHNMLQEGIVSNNNTESEQLHQQLHQQEIFPPSPPPQINTNTNTSLNTDTNNNEIITT
jgi:NAD-dependent SIR2 family protein deacetylase